MTKPFLKWVGGKTQIIEDVMGLFPKCIENYHEPFVGGGSVLFAYLSRGTKTSGKVYASDVNPTLIGVYKNIQKDPETFIVETHKLIEEFNSCTGTEVNRKPMNIEEAKTSRESYYYWTRVQFNAIPKEERGSIKASCLFIFMNKTCFRGVYREGPNGFNVPYGNYKNPAIIDDAHIRNVSILIQNVIFTVESFTTSMIRVKRGDFIYLDPPYAPTTTTSFGKYNVGGFGLEDHQKLFKLCQGLECSMLMSNANVELVRDAFTGSHYNSKTILCKRAIHSKDPNSKAEELLISHSVQQTPLDSP
jgi:DNA adenine methylase